ncbi:TKL protein kinase, variant [Capsaspora owczarzaki ATCC 30864]|uniref:TKL protein kinase n=1 Tax=Capsaspora owczarzaki (strain ATCC 30864) TaxID=595528 RepID=A0A0D2WNL9_CAPO3|nr:TKL protein kinase [Capsaspora owczarzaki ATCC 30864]KJE92761.1 TKL protein kinase, variant [Capsaspora owczarzaki ATCC 30864]
MPNRPPAATGRGNRRPTHLGRSFAALVAALGCLCLCVVHFASVPVDAVYACDFPGPPVVPGVCYCAGTSVSGCQSNLTTLPTFPVETTFLNLAYMQLTQISANAFSGLNQLTILYFNNNQQLLTIAPGAFTGLTALQTLSISNTGLTAIPTTALTSLTLLSTLTIDSNPYITSVESNAFAGLTSLTMLTLTYNQITSIAGFAFSSLTSLMTIALSYNPVSTLAPNAFAGPSSLTRLTFGTNRLTTLPSNAFSGLSALKFLDLSTSQFMTLPFNAFSGLNQLVTLYLRDSPMTTLPPGLFQGLYSLSSVVLAPNNFTFSGSTAPPSTYISASNPAMCSASCATCVSSASNCCPTNCLYCDDAATCSTCYPGYIMQSGYCVVSPASTSVASLASAASRSAASSFSAFIATSATARSASSATAASASAASFASASAASLALAIATSVASYASHLVAASASAASTASASAAVLASAISASVASQASSLVAASASAASTASASAGILASAASTASASLASVASVASVATTASASVASTASASAASAEFVRSTSAVVAESAASLSSLSAASVGAATSGLRAASGSGGSVAGVVGGVAGGIVVVALLVALLVLRRRRQRQRHNLESASKTSVPLVPMQSVQLSPASSGVMEEPTYATAKMPHAAAAADPTYAAVGQVGYSTPEYAYAASERIYSSAAPVTRSLRDGILMGAKLGSGAFGVVLRGQLPRNLVPADAQYLLTSPTQQYLDVAVKKMLPDATDKDRKEFIEEVRMVTQFSNPNVVRAIAALLEAEPFMCVLELMPYGDLRAVLQKSQLRNIEWSVGEFAHALAQVASGLDYLQSIRFVHRDIAARNCLVGAGLAVKISDFGLSRSLAAESDYYRMQTKGRLPVKWMAPECLLFRKFTHQSDVWAFGILAWEVYAYGASPYGKTTGPEILAAIESGRRLEQPDACPVATFEQMYRCWERDPDARPSFHHLCSFFSASASGHSIRDVGLLVNG